MISKLFFFVIILHLKFGKSTRRLVLGKPTLVDKGFMVYFLKSDKSQNREYDSWLCGGAIVSSTHILTAAACITDVSHLYVIAGYRKYVKSEFLDEDECTKTRKQRVIKTCTPKQYNFNYKNSSLWITFDIGFAIVEKPYDFSDLTYRLQCSYVPRPISINYDGIYAGTDTVIFGWGHGRGLRMPGDSTNYNSLYLQEASTRTLTKSYCKSLVQDVKLKEVVENYMICTSGAGNLDSEGNIIDPGEYKYNNGCNRKQMGVDGQCNDDYDSLESRRNGTDTTDILNNTKEYQYNYTATTNKTRRQILSRRQGLCTNDHGGPLVTWQGNKEVVIAVASTSLYDEHHFCVAPSLYTRTRCVMRFLMCGLQMGTATEDGGSGQKLCDMAKEEGYELDERDVKWSYYSGNTNDNNNTTEYDVTQTTHSNTTSDNPNSQRLNAETTVVADIEADWNTIIQHNKTKSFSEISEKVNHKNVTQNVEQTRSDNHDKLRSGVVDILDEEPDDLETFVDVI